MTGDWRSLGSVPAGSARPGHVKIHLLLPNIFMTSKCGKISNAIVFFSCMRVCDRMYRVLSRGHVGSVAWWNWTRCSLCSLPGLRIGTVRAVAKKGAIHWNHLNKWPNT